MSGSDAGEARITVELRAANQQLAEAEAVNQRLRTQLRAARGNEDRLQKQLRALRRSFSWRITYPIRVLQRALARKKA